MNIFIADPDFGIVSGPFDMKEEFFHPRDACSGETCVIHNSSDHHMREWPMVLRLDKEALIERICPHGIGHPDPDSIAHFKRRGETALGVHGCDGDCSTKGYLVTLRNETPCAHCGDGPIEWHHPDHPNKPHRRISSLAQRQPWATIAQELEVCTPLCRSCHMKEDGRAAALSSAKPNQPGTSHSPKPCHLCAQPYKPLRKGLCYGCYENHREGGRRFKGHVYSDGCCSAENAIREPA